MFHVVVESGMPERIPELLENFATAELKLEQLEMPGDAQLGDRPIHIAAKMGLIKTIKTLCSLGAGVDSPNQQLDTALIIACRMRNFDCVKTLLELGADVTKRGCNGRNALHTAAMTGDDEIFNFLLDNVIDCQWLLQAKDFSEEGNSCIHFAAIGNHVNIGRTIRAKYPEAVYALSAIKYSAIHLAAASGSLQFLQWLVDDCEVHVDDVGWLDKTPLHKAAENGHVCIAEFLITKGADLNRYELQIGGTPLHLSAMYGKYDMCRYLLEVGAHLNQETFMFHLLPIHVAAVHGQIDVIELFLNVEYAKIDVKGKLGRTPLMLACGAGHSHTVEYLCSRGARLEERDDHLKATALHFSCWYGQLGVIEQLLRLGADRRARDAIGDTPLHWACQAKQVKTAAFLMTRGAETGAKDVRMGRTPLHDAASTGSIEIVRLLLTRADIQVVDMENWATALHLSAWFGHASIVDLLLKRRARIEAQDRNGLTAVHCKLIIKTKTFHFLLI